ncbi:hypothetical protein DFH09DRAFT_1283959 [Mycena vulgaris]|nr:hypothetical protein DFH09DRAFT_1283959 [Mycena vulgaris]
MATTMRRPVDLAPPSRAAPRKQRLLELENEQRIEDTEAHKMTEEQRLSLFHSFRSVKFKWSDLDGNDTACAPCVAATMCVIPPWAATPVHGISNSDLFVPAVATTPPPGAPASTAARPRDADAGALINQDEPQDEKSALGHQQSLPSPSRPPLARQVRSALPARRSQSALEPTFPIPIISSTMRPQFPLLPNLNPNHAAADVRLKAL